MPSSIQSRREAVQRRLEQFQQPGIPNPIRERSAGEVGGGVSDLFATAQQYFTESNDREQYRQQLEVDSLLTKGHAEILQDEQYSPDRYLSRTQELLNSNMTGLPDRTSEYLMHKWSNTFANKGAELTISQAQRQDTETIHAFQNQIDDTLGNIEQLVKNGDLASAELMAQEHGAFADALAGRNPLYQPSDAEGAKLAMKTRLQSSTIVLGAREVYNLALELEDASVFNNHVSEQSQNGDIEPPAWREALPQLNSMRTQLNALLDSTHAENQEKAQELMLDIASQRNYMYEALKSGDSIEGHTSKMIELAVEVNELNPAYGAQLENAMNLQQGIEEIADVIPELHRAAALGQTPDINEVLRKARGLTHRGQTALGEYYRSMGWFSGRLEEERNQKLRSSAATFFDRIRNTDRPQQFVNDNSAMLREIERVDPTTANQIRIEAGHRQSIQPAVAAINEVIGSPGGSETAIRILQGAYANSTQEQRAMLQQEVMPSIRNASDIETWEARDLRFTQFMDSEQAMLDAARRGDSSTAAGHLESMRAYAESATDWDPDVRQAVKSQIEIAEGEVESIKWVERLKQATGNQTEQIRIYTDFINTTDLSNAAFNVVTDKFRELSPYISNVDAFIADVSASNAVTEMDRIQNAWGTEGFDHESAIASVSNSVNNLQRIDYAEAEDLRVRLMRIKQAVPHIDNYYKTLRQEGRTAAEYTLTMGIASGAVSDQTRDMILDATNSTSDIMDINASNEKRAHDKSIVVMNKHLGVPGNESAFDEAAEEADAAIARWSMFDPAAAAVAKENLDANIGINNFAVAAIAAYEQGNVEGNEFLAQFKVGETYEGVTITQDMHNAAQQLSANAGELALARANARFEELSDQMRSNIQGLVNDTKGVDGFFDWLYEDDRLDQSLEAFEKAKEEMIRIAPERRDEIANLVSAYRTVVYTRPVVNDMHDAFRENGPNGIREFLKDPRFINYTSEHYQYIRSVYETYKPIWGMADQWETMVANAKISQNREVIENMASTGASVQDEAKKMELMMDGFVKDGVITKEQAQLELEELNAETNGWRIANDIRDSGDQRSEVMWETANKLLSSPDRANQKAAVHLQQHAKTLEKKELAETKHLHSQARSFIDGVLAGRVHPDEAVTLLSHEGLADPELRMDVIASAKAADIIAKDPQNARAIVESFSSKSLNPAERRLHGHLSKALANLDSDIEVDPANAVIQWMEPEKLEQYGYTEELMRGVEGAFGEARRLASAQNADTQAVIQALGPALGSLPRLATAIFKASLELDIDNPAALPKGLLNEVGRIYHYGDHDVQVMLIKGIAGLGGESETIFNALGASGQYEAVSMSFAGDALIDGRDADASMIINGYRTLKNMPEGSISRHGFETTVRQEGLLLAYPDPVERENILTIAHGVSVASDPKTETQAVGSIAGERNASNSMETVLGRMYRRSGQMWLGGRKNWIKWPKGITEDQLDDMDADMVYAAFPHLLRGREFHNIDRESASDIIMDDDTYWRHIEDNKYVPFTYSDIEDASNPQALMVETDNGLEEFVLDLDLVFYKPPPRPQRGKTGRNWKWH